MAEPCLLCASVQTVFYHQDKQRRYEQCQRCALVFVAAASHLDSASEKAIYDLHQNNPDDPAYRQFLDRLCLPLAERLQAGATGLDFGCGPGPALQQMMQARGFCMNTYDIYYQPDRSVLQQSYDFITLTEVIEHLAQPWPVLSLLWQQLTPGGWLGIMTKLVRDQHAFSRWHYKNDPTHIAFYSQATLDFIASQWGVAWQPVADDAFVIQKPCL